MPTQLIINADDYGLTSRVNRAIRELLVSGSISSTSIMANLVEAEDAEALNSILQKCSCSAGIHLNLTLGNALTGPSSLTNSQGAFFTYPELRRRLLGFRIRFNDILAEISAQIKKIQRSGIIPVHIDSHQNVHAFPQVFLALCLCAKRHDIRAMRTHRRYFVPVSSGRQKYEKSARAHVTGIVASLYAKICKIQGVTMPRYMVESAERGWKTSWPLWRSVLENLPEKTSEIFVHPGYLSDDLAERTRYIKERDMERQALTQLPEFLAHSTFDIALISYQELLSHEKMRRVS